MKTRGRLREIVIIVVGVLGTNAALTSLAHENGSTQARLAIEQLHKQDVEATLSGKADDFAKLWDNEAVRIQPGAPAEIGKVVIHADDKREEAKSGGGQNVCYRAEIGE
jgi:hypothetical protein